MAKRYLLVFCALAALVGLQACATRGNEFPSDVSWIKKDVTKKADVKNFLGDPYQVGYASGQPTWTYGHYKYRLFGDSHTKELKFYWNRNGTVANFSFTSSFPEDVKKGSVPAPAEAVEPTSTTAPASAAPLVD